MFLKPSPPSRSITVPHLCYDSPQCPHLRFNRRSVGSYATERFYCYQPTSGPRKLDIVCHVSTVWARVTRGAVCLQGPATSVPSSEKELMRVPCPPSTGTLNLRVPDPGDHEAGGRKVW